MNEKLKILLNSEYIYDNYEGVPLKSNNLFYWYNELEPTLSIEKEELILKSLWYRTSTKEEYDTYMNECNECVSEVVELTRKEWDEIMCYLNTKNDSDKIKNVLDREMRWR